MTQRRSLFLLEPFNFSSTTAGPNLKFTNGRCQLREVIVRQSFLNLWAGCEIKDQVIQKNSENSLRASCEAESNVPRVCLAISWLDLGSSYPDLFRLLPCLLKKCFRMNSTSYSHYVHITYIQQKKPWTPWTQANWILSLSWCWPYSVTQANPKILSESLFFIGKIKQYWEKKEKGKQY